MSKYYKKKKYPKKTKNQLDKIKHIVVLMMENRSFDNMLGWLYHETTQRSDQPKFDGLDYNMWNPLNNFDSDGNAFIEKVPVEKNGKKKKSDNPVDFSLPNPDPGEGFKDTNFQLYGTYDVDSLYPPKAVNVGFVNNYLAANLYGTYSFGDKAVDPREIMKCYTPEQTPILSGLAKGFAVCDRYFCSLPSQTLPNRNFVHAATSTGYVNNHPNSICDAKTIFNQISDESKAKNLELSWKIYCGTSYKGTLNSLTRSVMTQLAGEEFDPNFQLISKFYSDAKNGNLPSYSFIEPQFSGDDKNDQHPPQDIRPGEKFMSDLYKAISTSPCWEETLFIITYDEHGGCYDHVAPPTNAKNPDSSNPPGQKDFRFNRFGVRVPTVLISPWIEEGRIFRASGETPFDHSSIIKTIQECFNLTGNLTERDKIEDLTIG